MEEGALPEVRFDASRAQPIFPRPLKKRAYLVSIPVTSDLAELPTFIKPEWGGVQVFYGDYYLITGEDSRIAYGSAKIQWENMHTSLGKGEWVKTGIPLAYQTDIPCRITTFVPLGTGHTQETSYTLAPGDWVVRQPGGEVQHIKADRQPELYHSHEEAEAQGFYVMTAAEFATWAIAQVGLLR